jgi:hypothetical protein
MRVYTAHTCAGRPPVLVKEGFSWGAFIFGPLWLLAYRAWVPGVLALCAWIVLGAVVPEPFAGSVLFAMHWALGLFGRDLRRWALARAGYLLVHVVAAPDEDAALTSLLQRRPDLVTDTLGAEFAA